MLGRTQFLIAAHYATRVRNASYPGRVRITQLDSTADKEAGHSTGACRHPSSGRIHHQVIGQPNHPVWSSAASQGAVAAFHLVFKCVCWLSRSEPILVANHG